MTRSLILVLTFVLALMQPRTGGAEEVVSFLGGSGNLLTNPDGTHWVATESNLVKLDPEFREISRTPLAFSYPNDTDSEAGAALLAPGAEGAVFAYIRLAHWYEGAKRTLIFQIAFDAEGGWLGSTLLNDPFGQDHGVLNHGHGPTLLAGERFHLVAWTFRQDYSGFGNYLVRAVLLDNETGAKISDVEISNATDSFEDRHQYHHASGAASSADGESLYLPVRRTGPSPAVELHQISLSRSGSVPSTVAEGDGLTFAGAAVTSLNEDHTKIAVAARFSDSSPEAPLASGMSLSVFDRQTDAWVPGDTVRFEIGDVRGGPRLYSPPESEAIILGHPTGNGSGGRLYWFDGTSRLALTSTPFPGSPTFIFSVDGQIYFHNSWSYSLTSSSLSGSWDISIWAQPESRAYPLFTRQSHRRVIKIPQPRSSLG